MSNEVDRRGRSGRGRAEWERLVAAYEQGTVSRRAFCAEAGISPSALDYWRRKLREEGSVAPHFVELAPERSGWDVELALGDGVVLRLARR